MTDWTDIHPDFTKELQEEWEGFGFIHEQVEEWIKDCGFSPKDAEFALYVGDMDLIISELESSELNDLRGNYNKKMGENIDIKEPLLKRKIEKIIDPNDGSWKSIKLDFTPELIQEWQRHGFGYEEIKDWIDIGIKTTDAKFCAWLRDVKKVDAEWMLNYGKVEQLQSEFQQHLLTAQQIQIS